MKAEFIKINENKIKNASKRIYIAVTLIGIVFSAMLATDKTFAENMIPSVEKDSADEKNSDISNAQFANDNNKSISPQESDIRIILSENEKEWNDYIGKIMPLMNELGSKVFNTNFQTRYDKLFDRMSDVTWATLEIPLEDRNQDFYNYWLPELASILADLQQLEKDINASLPTETRNYMIKYLDEYGNPIPGVQEVIKTAKKGETITEIAPEIDGYFVLNGEKVITQTIEENTIFTFLYSNELKRIDLYYDVIGDSTAQVGEVKKYKYSQVEFFNDGTKTETIVNVEDTSQSLISSNPNDIINGGSIRFSSEGTRTITSGSGKTLTVVVNSATKVDDSKLNKAIKSAEDLLKKKTYITTRDLEVAILKGKEMLTNAHCTQEQVDECTKNIIDNMNALKVLKSDSDAGNNKVQNNNNSADSKKLGNSSNQNNNQNHHHPYPINSRNSNKVKLPKTGEIVNVNGIIIGLFITMLSVITILKEVKVKQK
ncbi:LPXTG cell wall anchor domain-containing protein [Enterococcus sp. 5H]|uniref:LPXTG cell wall anchor domain-containing protein n=1 Tax=Enterococcus sp. 5H TaxID=1229490 RepID=UPI00230497D0|nr:LPXTG cell wall anchor domain-containing protein [Enterococcus sp. 5H]MDA9471212.1 hypothetical protein [Enterococcus sp. 5H]